MKNKSEININQKKGMGANGTQTVKIDQSEHKHIHLKDPDYKNLVKTHVGSITFDPNSLRDVIVSIDKVTKQINKNATDFTSVDVEEKNKINGLTQSFYDGLVAVHFEPYFNEFDKFLKLRENEDLQKKIGNIASSLNHKIFINRSDYDTFEKMLSHIEDALIDSQYDQLKGKETVVNLVFYYLYASCLIGKKTQGENICSNPTDL
ncbi:MAG: hypothetical protein FP812_07360 [Desulfobacula sp.]|nr:hypothetical protein [Desulfobacula sp.]